mmetsp:Transcript_15337/g.31756  ORF Transcript_15337/g.31756 Transcript_15337/m.31756 type:complete len:92 (+) Transcript_15337:325-600(+)
MRPTFTRKPKIPSPASSNAEYSAFQAIARQQQQQQQHRHALLFPSTPALVVANTTATNRILQRRVYCPPGNCLLNNSNSAMLGWILLCGLR